MSAPALTRPAPQEASPASVAAATRRRIRGASRRRLVILALAVLAVAAFAVTLMAGRTFYPPGDVWRVILGEQVPGASFTVGRLRLPRAVLALVAGFSFGLAGVTIQTMLRNPLASPDIIGISSGASAAAAIAIVTLSLGEVQVSVLAIAAGLGVALLVYSLAFQAGRSVSRGVGVSGCAVRPWPTNDRGAPSGRGGLRKPSARHRVRSSPEAPAPDPVRHGDGVRVPGTDLHREIAVTAPRVEPVPGELRHRDEPGRPCPRQPVPPVEQRGTHPDGDGQPVLRAPYRRHVRVQRGDPGRQGAAPHGQLLQESRQFGPVPRQHVEGGETTEPLLPGEDPRLVRPVELHPPVAGAGAGRRRAGSGPHRHRAGQARGPHDTRGSPHEDPSAGTRIPALVTFRHGRSPSGISAVRSGSSALPHGTPAQHGSPGHGGSLGPGG
ncbi:Vitamin B12 import system permease protein BtuC [Streptomyces cyaneofuscatus]